MENSQIKSVYFVGAGGIGMSALVRFFLSNGKKVAGYDKTPCDLTATLISEGADIHYEDNVSLIPEYCRDKSSTLVVYTPAIPQDHSELTWFRTSGFDLQKRAQVLGTLTRDMDGLCVAGTHGKTTTSAMAAYILDGTDEGCNAFLGGILKNSRSNLMLGGRSRRVVIEADEFDRSFHQLRPLRSVITAMDADHLDIYGDYQSYVESFRHYSSLIRKGGDLILRYGLEEKLKPENKDVRIWSYSAGKGDFHAENVRIGNGGIVFDFISPLGNIEDISLGVPVQINIENGVAAMALAQLSGADKDVIRTRMASFRGTDRRFDFHLKTDSKVYVSDYAHHPAELRQCAISMRSLYPDRKITAIFQPHLYTRTRDFYRDFADSLSLFDEVWLTDIYPAREQPIPGITSRIIADNIRAGVCRGVISLSDVLDMVRSEADDIQVLLTVGAGDLDNLADKITGILSNK